MFVLVRDILEAAGIVDGLDTQSDLSNNTMRYDGVVLLMAFNYFNDYPVSLDRSIAWSRL